MSDFDVQSVRRRVSRGWVRGVRTHPCFSYGRFYTYVLNNVDVVITIIYSQKYLVSKLPHFIATTWCKGHIFGILSTLIDSPVICLKCKETHLKFHSTSSSDPSLLFFLHTPLLSFLKEAYVHKLPAYSFTTILILLQPQSSGECELNVFRASRSKKNHFAARPPLHYCSPVAPLLSRR